MLRYKEIKQNLQELIAGMQTGDSLPSRPVLCRRLDTTRTTLDKAIRELAGEGILESKNGSGTYVTELGGAPMQHAGQWGVIVPNIMSSLYPGIVRGVENIAQQVGATVMLCNSDSNADKQERYIKRLKQSGVSGFIIVPVISRDLQATFRLYGELIESKIPFVFCNRAVEGIDAPVVTSNDFYGGYIATRHLIERGYRNIAFISKIRYKTSIDRCHGYLSALMESGLPIDRSIISLEEEPCLDEDGYCSMKRLLEQGGPIDAVFCFNDFVALGVRRAVEERGLSVSDHIGIIGYDNSELCERSEPKLTSLSYMNVEIGAKAAELLWKMVNHEPLSTFNYYLFQPSIIVRESCRGPVQPTEARG